MPGQPGVFRVARRTASATTGSSSVRRRPGRPRGASHATGAAGRVVHDRVHEDDHAGKVVVLTKLAVKACTQDRSARSSSGTGTVANPIAESLIP